MLLKPNPTNSCFGCGAANPRGMQLTFEQDDASRSIRGAFRLGAEYQGSASFVHGGIIATVLDEAMGKVNRFRAVRAVTAELTVEYIKPVPIDADLLVEAHELNKKGRSMYYVGEIRNSAGDLLARSRGRFVEIGPSKSAADATTSVAQ